MIEDLVLASNNAGKIKEFEEMFKRFKIKLHKLSEYGDLDIEENGLSFVENALIKARAVAKFTNLPAIADDSGLCVDILNGAPGIRSARFSGVHGDDEANNDKLLDLLASYKQKEQRRAHYTCAIALVRTADDPDPLIAVDYWHGYINFNRVGNGGFGYDPLFMIEKRGLSAAELPPQIKNLMSHRAKALAKLEILLEQVYA